MDGGATRRAWSGCGRSLSPGGTLLTPLLVLFSVAGLLSGTPRLTDVKDCDKPCVNGRCNAATGGCVCLAGWVGEQCQHCGGRFRYGARRG